LDPLQTTTNSAHSSVFTHMHERSTVHCQTHHALLRSCGVVRGANSALRAVLTCSSVSGLVMSHGRPTADAASSAEPSRARCPPASRAAPPRTRPHLRAAPSQGPRSSWPVHLRMIELRIRVQLHAVNHRVRQEYVTFEHGAHDVRWRRIRHQADYSLSRRGPNTAQTDRRTRSRSRPLKWKVPSA
jgi:hypothetical protein